MTFFEPKWIAYFGFFISFISAFVFPAFGYVFSEIQFVFFEPESPDFGSDRDFYIAMFGLVALAAMATGILQKWAFTTGGENLVKTFRMKLYTGIIYKHIGWFDSKERAPGVLSNILS